MCQAGDGHQGTWSGRSVFGARLLVAQDPERKLAVDDADLASTSELRGVVSDAVAIAETPVVALDVGIDDGGQEATADNQLLEESEIDDSTLVCHGDPGETGATGPTGPTVALMKQGRAFGMGVVVATLNAMDLDYRALESAGFWAVGRLQTDADRERVVDSLANANEAGSTAAEIDNVIRRLGPRWFFGEERARDAEYVARAAEVGDVFFCGADDVGGCEAGGGGPRVRPGQSRSSRLFRSWAGQSVLGFRTTPFKA